jgi:hypothetical protein
VPVVTLIPAELAEKLEPSIRFNCPIRYGKKAFLFIIYKRLYDRVATAVRSSSVPTSTACEHIADRRLQVRSQPSRREDHTVSCTLYMSLRRAADLRRPDDTFRSYVDRGDTCWLLFDNGSVFSSSGLSSSVMSISVSPLSADYDFLDFSLVTLSLTSLW